MSPQKIVLRFFVFFVFIGFVELPLVTGIQSSPCPCFINPMNSINSMNPTNAINAIPFDAGSCGIINCAILDVYDAIRHGGDVLLMGDDDNGCALGVDLFKDIHHIMGCAAIQCTRGFICQQNGRLGDHGPGNGCALFLTHSVWQTGPITCRRNSPAGKNNAQPLPGP